MKDYTRWTEDVAAKVHYEGLFFDAFPEWLLWEMYEAELSPGHALNRMVEYAEADGPDQDPGTRRAESGYAQ
jgi:hypothetical protein